jgi:hypothetical protein
MSGGTGVSTVVDVSPDADASSLLKSAYPYGTPHGLGGNAALYASKGGYVPEIHMASNKAATPAKKKLGPGKKMKKGGKSKKGGRSKRNNATKKNRTRRVYH